MKKVLFVIMAMVCCCSTFALGNTEGTDSTKTKKISTRRYLNDAKTIYTYPGLFSVGWNYGVSMPDNMDKANYHSVNVTWDLINLASELGSKNHRLVCGFGMQWNKYATSDNVIFNKEGNKITATKQGDYSRYLTYALTIPLMYQYRTNGGLYFNVGPVINFNLYSSVYNEYHENGERMKETQRGAFHNPITCDIRLGFGFENFGVMFKYSPVNVIQSGKGPQFHSFGFGIVLSGY